jgi:hypothetical protein
MQPLLLLHNLSVMLPLRLASVQFARLGRRAVGMRHSLLQGSWRTSLQLA